MLSIPFSIPFSFGGKCYICAMRCTMTGTVGKKLLFCAASSLLIGAVLAVSVSAAPALRGRFLRTQPDGNCFYVNISGDEFTRLSVTDDGRPVVKDADGWYCYAVIGADGRRSSSGVRVPGTAVTRGGEEEGRIGRTEVRPAESIVHAVNLAAEPARAVMDRMRTAAAERMRSGSVREVRVIILLAEFSDLKFRYSRSDFVDLVNKDGYSVNGASGSIRDYFTDQFGDECSFTFDVGPVVSLSKGYAYYGKNGSNGNDAKAHEAVIEACRLSDAEVDFSRYDLDGDGCVDHIFVFYAGTDEARGADEDHIWSHSWAIRDGAGLSVVLDGVSLNAYSMTSEIAYYSSLDKSALSPIGSFCHEFAHMLGLKDMYDTDYEDSGGRSKGFWKSISLMDSGNYNNDGRTPPNFTALELEMLCIGECLDLSTGAFSLTAGEKTYCRYEGDYPGEFYLFECRSAEGWDEYIGGSGLLICHVDRSERDAGYSTREGKVITAAERFALNEINCRPDHMCAELVGTKSSCSSVGEVFWPNGSRNIFSGGTSPAFSFWSGAKSEISLTDIRRSGKTVSFNVSGPVSISSVEAFQNAAIVCWGSSRGEDEECNISWTGGGKSSSASVEPYEEGRYAYIIEGLEEKTDYTVRVYFGGGENDASTRTFTTRAYYSSGYPFIYLSSGERDSTGRFVKGTRIPLRIYNARDVARVDWFFDGEAISAERTGYYTLPGSGVLKAVVHYGDGSSDIICKTVTVK